MTKTAIGKGGKGAAKGRGKGAAKGRGKGVAKGGKGAAKRHRQALLCKSGISKNDIKRLARRAGVKRLSHDVYDKVHDCLKKFVRATICDAHYYTLYAGRITVSAMDIVYALKRQGKTLYGFGG